MNKIGSNATHKMMIVSAVLRMAAVFVVLFGRMNIMSESVVG